MIEQIKKIKNFKPLEEIKKTEKEFRKTTITLILGGFGMVAALAWNEAIKSLFEMFLEKSNELIGKFIYALIVTIILVIVSMRVRKITENEENN